MKRLNLLLITLFILLSPLLLFSEQSISIKGGAELVEEAYAYLYRSQVAPTLLLTYRGEKRVLGCRILNRLSTELLLWPLFIKNERLYYTERTLALNIPLEYGLTFRLPPGRKVEFEVGFVLRSEVRWDRYSLGTSYWYSELRLTPLLPLMELGLYLKPFRFMEIILSEQLGAMVNFILFFSKDYYKGLFYQLYAYHALNIEFRFRVGPKHKLLAGFRNSIRLNQSLSDYHSLVFFRNLFYLGVSYEI